MCRQSATRKSKNLINDEEDESTPLPIGFVPGPMDVICSRGKSSFKHPGNCQYRKIIQMNLPLYSAAKTKSDKSLIVSETMNSIREGSSSGIGFVKAMKDGRWYEVGESIVREKIGQSFRDMLHDKYSSSSKAKLIRRKNKRNNSTLATSSKKRVLADKKIQLPSQNTKLEQLSHSSPCSNIETINKNGQEQELPISSAKEYSEKITIGDGPVYAFPDEAPVCAFQDEAPVCAFPDEEPVYAFPDEEPVYAFPVVSPDNSFSVPEGSGKEWLNAMDSLISEQDIQTLQAEGMVEPTYLPLSLSFSSEPIPISLTASMSDYFCNESTSSREELLGAMASLWDMESPLQ